ncbi:tyrosine-type recombinase/integrase [Sandarakinorhabdus sp.]|uniref:tyrosine-type recombinase/integrase n=1 Tax=Sandarakinorhabdus sp. TaxID=1916663 RepID=UPI00286D8294|nr:tyrosine-type recombinase/integrase [Sandarakinorhabdus sp.]
MTRPRSPFPANVSAYRDRHGKLRTRFRRTGHAAHDFKSEPFSPAWWAEYAACKAGLAAPAITPGEARSVPGTIGDLIARYYGSADWQRPSDRTRHSFRLVIERFRQPFQHIPVASFGYEESSAIMAKFADRPNAGNKLRKLLSRIWDEGMRMKIVADNPWKLVRPYQVKGGFHTWTEAEIAQYKRRWPPGTREWLALALMLNTAQRRSDAIRLGRQNVRGGRLSFKQRKTDKALDLPIIAELHEALDGFTSGHMTYLVTEQGKPFTDAGFGNWFAERCIAAGVPGRAHGLRKAASVRLANAGASQQEIKSWTGHSSDKEVTRYVEAANRSQLADSAADKLANPPKRFANLSGQGVDIKRL